jgi:transposase
MSKIKKQGNTKVTDDELRAALTPTTTKKQSAKQFGVTYSTIRTRLKKLGLTTRTNIFVKHAAIIQSCSETKTIREIADETHSTPTIVRYLVNKLGLPYKLAGSGKIHGVPPELQQRNQQMVIERERGCTLEEIGKRHGEISRERVRQIVTKAGVARQPKTWAKSNQDKDNLIHICPTCNKKFNGYIKTSPTKKYCSQQCYSKAMTKCKGEILWDAWFGWLRLGSYRKATMYIENQITIMTINRKFREMGIKVKRGSWNRPRKRVKRG